MNAKYLIAALVVLAGPAFAQAASTTSGVTRAEVRAELARARAAGELPLSEANFLPYYFASASGQSAPESARNVHVCKNEAECAAAPQRDFTVTRAQVVAELYRARAAGEIAETEADNDVGRAALRSYSK